MDERQIEREKDVRNKTMNVKECMNGQRKDEEEKEEKAEEASTIRQHEACLLTMGLSALLFQSVHQQFSI